MIRTLPSWTVSRPGRALGAAALGAAIGIVSVTVHGPALLLGILMLAGLVALISWWLPAGPVLLIALVIIVPRDLLFGGGIGVAGGALKVTDLIVIVTLSVWAFRWATGRAHRVPPLIVLVLLVAFLAFAALGVLTAHWEGSSVKVALTELRPLLSYALILPIVAGIRSIQDLQRAWLLVLGACAAASLVTIWLYVAGQGSAATFSGGAIRVTEIPFIPPLVLMLWSLLLLANARSRERRLVLVASGALATAALFFTFQRAAWLTALVGLAGVIVVLPRPRRRRLLLLLAPTVVVALAAVLVLNATSAVHVQDPLTSGLDRLVSLAQFSQDSSTQHRVVEAHAAVAAIATRPYTGIGLGNTITFISPLFNAETNAPGIVVSEFYIHNSYLWFPLKLGIPGAAVFFVFIAVSLLLGIGAVRRLGGSPERILALGATVTLASMVLVSATGPHLNGDTTTPLIALAIATICLLQPSVGRGRLS
jgi:O-antigen ligase